MLIRSSPELGNQSDISGICRMSWSRANDDGVEVLKVRVESIVVEDEARVVDVDRFDGDGELRAEEAYDVVRE